MSFAVKATGFRSVKDNDQVGCAAHLEHRDAHGRTSSRYMAFPLQKMSPPMSELWAATMALSSIPERFRTEPTELRFSEYVTRMLAKDGDNYIADAKLNKDEIQNLRKLYDTYSKPILIDYDRSALEKVSADAKMAAETKHHMDSGSLIASKTYA